jgi:hypothetical protein
MQCACAFTKSRSLGADVYMGECYMKQWSVSQGTLKTASKPPGAGRKVE